MTNRRTTDKQTRGLDKSLRDLKAEIESDLARRTEEGRGRIEAEIASYVSRNPSIKKDPNMYKLLWERMKESFTRYLRRKDLALCRDLHRLYVTKNGLGLMYIPQPREEFYFTKRWGRGNDKRNT